MKTRIFFIVVLLLIAVALYSVAMNISNEVEVNPASNPATSTLLRECPDEMIVNRMPGTNPQSSYYIVNGERRELSQYDQEWVSANCSVPTQIVY